MNLYNELKSKYKENIPFSIYEIQNMMNNTYSKIRIFQLINELIKENKLVRYEKGLYYLPSQTIFGNSILNTQKVIERKYLQDNNKTIGFFTGLTLMNKLGLTTQVPNIIEICTNKEASRVREISVGNQKVRLRCPRIEINNNNYIILQFLEMINQLKSDEIEVQKTLILDYYYSNKVKLKQLIEYIKEYPGKVFKNIVKLGILNGNL